MIISLLRFRLNIGVEPMESMSFEWELMLRYDYDFTTRFRHDYDKASISLRQGFDTVRQGFDTVSISFRNAPTL